jgi:hypothetical protein
MSEGRLQAASSFRERIRSQLEMRDQWLGAFATFDQSDVMTGSEFEMKLRL